MRVTHDTYGAGRVTGRVDKNRVIVQFDNHDGFHGRRPLIVQEYQLDAVSMDDATTGLISNMEAVHKTGVVGLATLWMTVEHIANTYSTKSVSLLKSEHYANCQGQGCFETHLCPPCDADYREEMAASEERDLNDSFYADCM